MPLTIACLHTGPGHPALFDTAAAALPGGALRLTHGVEPGWLRPPDAALTRAVRARLLALLATADAAVLTCTTLGPVFEGWRDAPPALLRADAALAEAATRSGEPVRVLFTAPGTGPALAKLFRRAAGASGARVSVQEVPGAWALLGAGELAAYHAAIAAAAREGEGRIVLAQASMAPAAALIAGAPPLTLPGPALLAAARAALLRRKTL